MNNSTGDYSTGEYSTGHYSTGDCSTGYRSTGYCSTGYCSTGHYSTGNFSTGDRSTGDYSTGYCSTGYCSAGDYSTGDYSTGYGSTGNWSISKYSTGHFSTVDYSGFGAFNKTCTPEKWESATKPNFLYFHLTRWTQESEMSDEEKKNNPTHKTTGGYLKVYDYKEAFQAAFDKASDEEIEQLKALPNFDADVFKEISGIDIRDRDKVKVAANGKTVWISKESAKELGL